MSVQPEVLAAAYALLSRRSYFTEALRQRLLSKSFSRESVEEVVSYLTERKFLNDKATTQRFIESKSGKDSVGREKLKAELERRGVPDEVIEESLASLPDDAARALTCLQAKYGDGADRGKAGRFLYAHGFDECSIESALDRFCPE
jgi:regulatory protein